MTFHREVLTKAGLKVTGAIGPLLKERHFYLGGGTALALYLGHRKSKDLAWFRTDPIRDPLRLGKELQDTGIPIDLHQVERGSLEGTVSGVRVSLFEYRYPLLQAVSTWTDPGVDLASLRDLAAMKLSAVTQRGSKKDFIDIFALGRSGLDLAEMLAAYQEKFNTREIGHVVYALSYFEEADRERSPVMIWKANWAAVKNTIREWVRDWVNRTGRSIQR